MSRTTLSLALIATAAAIVNAKPAYVARLPNGDNVSGVAALGHVNPDGGGTNNDFGLDFESAGEKWTLEFCQKDSDGDGQTNGQELGDPCCTWVQDSNAVVTWSDGVSHPGDSSSTSDESLWADITCASTSNSTTSSTQGSSASTVEAGSTDATTDAGTITSSTSGDVTDSSDAAASSSTSAASTTGPAVYSAVGLAAAIAAFFM